MQEGEFITNTIHHEPNDTSFKLHGLLVGYNLNGDTILKSNYRNGLLHGEVIVNDNYGRFLGQVNYENGVQQGPYLYLQTEPIPHFYQGCYDKGVKLPVYEKFFFSGDRLCKSMYHKTETHGDTLLVDYAMKPEVITKDDGDTIDFSTKYAGVDFNIRYPRSRNGKAIKNKVWVNVSITNYNYEPMYLTADSIITQFFHKGEYVADVKTMDYMRYCGRVKSKENGYKAMAVIFGVLTAGATVMASSSPTTESVDVRTTDAYGNTVSERTVEVSYHDSQSTAQASEEIGDAADAIWNYAEQSADAEREGYLHSVYLKPGVTYNFKFCIFPRELVGQKKLPQWILLPVYRFKGMAINGHPVSI